MKTLPLSEAKTRFNRLVDDVSRRGARFLITKNGRAAAVLLSADELESLEETLAIMSDPDLMAQIRRNIKAIEDDTGKWWDLDDLDENFKPKPGRRPGRLSELRKRARRTASAKK